METQAFLDLIWSTGSHDSIAGMYNKAHEVLQTALLGMEQLETQYDYIGVALARALMMDVTKARVRHFLRAKTEYAVDVRPHPRMSWNWSSIQDRYVKWQADLIDLRNLNVGFPYALTIVDTFSKFAFAFPMANKEGDTVARLLDALFARRPMFGRNTSQFRPLLLLTDQGSEFTSTLTYSVCKFHRVFQIFSFSYSPLGMIERFNQTLKRKLRKAIAKGRMTADNFPTLLQAVLRDYNNTVHSTTKQRPVVLHFVMEEPYMQRVLHDVRQRILSIRQKAEMRAHSALAPLNPGDIVRVLSLKDPLLSRKARYLQGKRLTYKKFGHSHWTKHRFIIASRDERDQYKLVGFGEEKFRREELQLGVS